VTREERAVQNEDLFRQLNDRLDALATLDGRDEVSERLVCECSATECSQPVELTASEYRQIRAGGARFVVYPSDAHFDPEVECAVTRGERYWVVEKLGDAAVIAERLDQGPSVL
jgi:hypothetical protein